MNTALPSGTPSKTRRNMPGVATQLLLSPEDGVGVVVLTNGYSLAVPHEIADLALGDLLGRADQVGLEAVIVLDEVLEG